MGAQQGSYEPQASDWQTVFDAAGAPLGLAGELSPLAQTRTFVTKIRPGAFAAIGNRVRAILMAQIAGAYPLTTLYIGPATAAVDHAWQFSAASQFTFDSGQATSQQLDGAQAAFETDGLDFLIDGSLGVCIAGDLPIGATPRYVQGLGDGVITFFKDNVNEASSLTKDSGYSPLPGFSFLIDRLEAANT